MKEINPQAAGLSLNILSGPTGAVDAEGREPWPNIAFEVAVCYRGREIVRSPYRLGVGHVKPFRAYDETTRARSAKLDADEEKLCHAWATRPHVRFTNPKTHANTAAKLAKVQGVAPTLEGVCASLLMDGSAYFNAESFEEWCVNFDHDPDSRKAEAIYRTCDEIGRALSRALPAETLNGLIEWAAEQ
jgi:hypothetical protein